MINQIKYGPTGILDRDSVQRIISEQNAIMGFEPDPHANPQKARAMMIARGIQPEDNLASCGIISAREEG